MLPLWRWRAFYIYSGSAFYLKERSGTTWVLLMFHSALHFPLKKVPQKPFSSAFSLCFHISACNKNIQCSLLPTAFQREALFVTYVVIHLRQILCIQEDEKFICALCAFSIICLRAVLNFKNIQRHKYSIMNFYL